MLLVILATTNTYAATAQITLTAAKTEVQLQEQVKVTVQALDANKQPVSEDVSVFVRISKGGLLPQKLLKEALVLKNGVGEFTFIAPAKVGATDILLIEPATNVSAKLTLNVVEEKLKINWKKESAKIASVKGNVAYKLAKENNWRSSQKDILLHEGDSIRTWDKSYVTLQLFDGTEMTLQPYTTMVIKDLKSSADNAEVKQSVFKVFTGKVLCRAKKYIEKGSRFAIETESTVAGIRGTVFEYSDTIDGDNELIVYDGAVMLEYIPQDLHFLVEKGHKVAIPAGEFAIPEQVEHAVTSEDREKQLQDEQTAIDAEEQAKKAAEEQAQKDAEEKAKKEAEEQAKKEAEERAKAASKKQGNGSLGGDNSEGALPNGPEVAEGTPKEQKDGNGLDDFLWDKLKPDQTKMEFGSERAEDQMFMTLSLQPEFRHILNSPLSVGLSLTVYQDMETGKVRIGSADKDTKLTNMFNWIEYDGKYLYGRYGVTSNISYGYGLLMGDYTKDKAICIQLGLNRITAAKLGLRVLLPLDIKSLYPWKTESTSSLYAGRLTSDFHFLFLPLRAGVNYVVDTNQDLAMLSYKVPTSGVSADLGMPLSSILEPYAEVSNLINFGTGAEVGVKGRFLSRFWYQGGFRAISEGFVPNYFGENYEIYKKNSIDQFHSLPISGRILPDLSEGEVYPATQGVYIKGGANFSLARLSVGYEDYNTIAAYAPILTGEFVASTPKIAGLPVINGGFTYKQVQFGKKGEDVNKWFNNNTMFSWFVNLPINKALTATYKSSFIPSDTEIKFTNQLGVSLPF